MHEETVRTRAAVCRANRPHARAALRAAQSRRQAVGGEATSVWRAAPLRPDETDSARLKERSRACREGARGSAGAARPSGFLGLRGGATCRVFFIASDCPNVG